MIFSYFSNLPKIYRVPLTVVGMAILGTIFFIVFGYAVMWLWNHVLAVVLDVPPVTFWQALGLFVLAKIFFGFGAGQQGGGAKHGQDKKRRGRAAAETTDEPPTATDDLFKKYWRDEGKQAYEAYLAGQAPAGDSDERT